MLSLTQADRSRQTQEPRARFSLTIESPEYASIPPLRKQMLAFLEHHGISRQYADMLLLSASEVLTNLVKHPRTKATQATVSICIGKDTVQMDIHDDSTPFASFDAKCNESLLQISSGNTLRESGYGLGCIQRMHTHVVYRPGVPARGEQNALHISDSLARAVSPQDHPLPDKESAAKTEDKKLVYLVDDDEDALAAYAFMLDDDFEVVAFTSGQALLTAYHTRRPSLIISDISMPDMDGISLRRALSETEGGDLTPFVFLSAHEEAGTLSYIGQLGVDDFITKPVERKKIIALAGRLIRRSEQITAALKGKSDIDIDHFLDPYMPETFRGWDFAVRNKTAETGGGDFTLHGIKDENFCGLLADTMGHGMQAKLFSYAYAGYLRSMFRHNHKCQGPGLFLDALSASVHGDPMLENIIMTCQCFRLGDGGLLQFATAGHPAPLVFGGKRCSVIDTAGPLPGLAPTVRYAQTELRLSPGEHVMIATDGFFDIFDGRNQHRDHLTAFLSSGISDEDPAESIWREFLRREKENHHIKDDATVIILTYRGERE